MANSKLDQNLIEKSEDLVVIDQLEIAEIFKVLEKTIRTSFKKSIEQGSVTLAKIHHHLFESAVQGSGSGSKREKSRLSLLFLKSKFHSIAEVIGSQKLGILIHCYSRHWFRLFLILESKAYQYLTWISHQPESFLDYVSILENLNSILPKVNRFEKEITYLQLTTELKELTVGTSSAVGSNLQNWIFKRMRLSLEKDKNDKLDDLQQFQSIIPSLFMLNISFDEVFHEFAKSWFRHSLELKRWFNQFNKRMDDKLLQRMYRGYWTLKFKNKPFSTVVNDYREAHEQKS